MGRNWRAALAVALTIAGSAMGGGALAHADESAGPHAAAPSAIDMPDTFSYNHGEISRREAAELGLSCNQFPSGVTCYDSQADALRAAGAPEEGASAQTSRHRSRSVRAKASSLYCEANNGRPLVLFQDGEFEGWNINTFTRQEWFNMQGIYDNEASSYRMGGHSGHIAEGLSGSGYWYPGPTGICDEGQHMGAYNWTDLTSSRYRN